MFTKPHPPRRRRDIPLDPFITSASIEDVHHAAASTSSLHELTPRSKRSTSASKPRNFYSVQTKCGSPLILVAASAANSHVVLMHSDGLMSMNYFHPTAKSKKGNLALPFSWQRDSTIGTSRERRSVHFNLFPAYTNILSNNFGVTADGKIMIASAGWEVPGGFNCLLMNGLRVVRSIFCHKDIITCVAIGSDDDTFITGSLDTMVFVWSLKDIVNPSSASQGPSLVLPSLTAPSIGGSSNTTASGGGSTLSMTSSSAGTVSGFLKEFDDDVDHFQTSILDSGNVSLGEGNLAIADSGEGNGKKAPSFFQ